MLVNLFPASIFVLLSIFTLSACSRPKPPEGTVTTFIDSAPKTLDPVQSTDAISQNLQNLTHAALIRIGRDMNPEPSLAEKYKIVGSRKFYFKLRQGLLFHDGTSITVDSVRKSLSRFMDEKNRSPHREVFSSIISLKESELKEYDFVIDTKKIEPFLIWELSLLKIHKLVENEIVGAGPYRVVKSTHGVIELERAGSEYPISRIIFNVVQEDTSRFQHLMRGDLNATQNALSLTALNKIKESGNFRIVNAPGINVSYLAFNFKNEILKNRQVRKALALSINYDQIIKERFDDFGFRSTGLLSYLHKDYEKDVVKYGYDPVLAEKLLDEAGYKRGKDGKRFKLEFKSTSEKSALDLVRIVADDFRRVGVNVTIRTTELGTFLSDIRNGSFEVFMSRWIGISNPSIYYRVFHSSQIGLLNRGTYQNAEMDKALDLAMNEENEKKRNEYFSKVQKIAADDLPYIPLWNWNNTYIGSETFDDPVPYPNGNYLMYAELKKRPNRGQTNE